MEFINVNLAMPLGAYLELENKAKRLKLTKNEIIMDAILRLLNSKEAQFGRIKNARFYNSYN